MKLAELESLSKIIRLILSASEDMLNLTAVWMSYAFEKKNPQTEYVRMRSHRGALAEIFNPLTPPRLSGQASISYKDSPGEHHTLDQEVKGKVKSI